MISSTGICVIAVLILPVAYGAIIKSEASDQLSAGNTSLSVVQQYPVVSSHREARRRYNYKDGGGDLGGAGGGGHHGGAQISAPQGGGEKNKGGKKGKDLMSRILPMLVMPFLISSSMIPMALTSLKFMLLKSMFIGKIAIFLLALNALWKSENNGGVYSHNINLDRDQKDLHMAHYGYNGAEEYGAYVNRRRSQR